MYKTLGWKNWIIAIAAAAVSFGCAARAADAPAPTPPPPPAFGADYQRMLNLLNLHGPAALPAMADDPGKTPGARLLPDGRHWADAREMESTVRPGAHGPTTTRPRPIPTPYTDPMRFKSGEKVQDAVTWWQRRRPEIRARF